MDFGCHLPVFGPIATRDNVLAFARRMEALGYDSLWASDHVALPHTIRSRYPYSETGQFPLPADANFLEPLTTLALVAGVTERVRLGTTILVLPHRNPVLAAKMLATLYHLRRYRDLGVHTVLFETRLRDLEDTVGICEAFARDIRPRAAR